MKKTPALALAAVAIAALLALTAGCGSGDDQAAAGNATDAAFIADMTPHHQGAIDMAKVARTKAEHPELRTLADDIIAAQQSEISVMGRIRGDLHAMGMTGAGHLGMTQQDMGIDMDLDALRGAAPFDRAFIDMMVPHHKGAIRMARVLLAKGEQPALRTMGKDIIAAQTREIAQMKSWRKQWYGSASGHGHDAMAGHG